MPPAKKPASRKTAARKPAARGTATASSTVENISAATRRQFENAAKRLEKALDDAQDALKSLRKDLGHGADRAYTDLSGGISNVRRDLQKTNRLLSKDLARLRTAVTPSRAKTASKPRATSTRKRTASSTSRTRSKTS
jgi:ABC-type transporter Mla subunit MlaD